MPIVIERVIKGNWREVPGDIPPGLWMDKIEEYREDPDRLAEVAFFDPVMEELTPADLVDLKARLLVWFEVTGEYPTDIAVWWPVRQARNRGELPLNGETTVTIDDAGVLHCGHCAARWSPPFSDHCNLCGHTWPGSEIQVTQQG